MNPEDYQRLLEIYAIPWGIRVVAALTILIIGRFVARLIVRILKKLMSRANVDETINNFLGSIFQATLTVIVVVAALEQLGVDTTSVLAIFAAAGLAVGLAFKDSLSNFASGIMLILFKPFRQGDFIDAAGVSGVVEEIRIFNTVMKGPDNREITIPNSHIYGDIITNYSARSTRRIDLVIGIGYDDNIGIAKNLIMDIFSRHEGILADPEPAVMVSNLGDSSVELAVRPWVNSSDYGTVRADLLQSIKETFDAAGISIPYPQTDVHLFRENPPG